MAPRRAPRRPPGRDRGGGLPWLREKYVRTSGSGRRQLLLAGLTVGYGLKVPEERPARRAQGPRAQQECELSLELQPGDRLDDEAPLGVQSHAGEQHRRVLAEGGVD